MGWFLVVKVGVNLVLVESVLVESVLEVIDKEDEPVTGSAVTRELMDEAVDVREGSTIESVIIVVAVELPDEVTMLESEAELRVLVDVPVALMVLVKTTVVSSAEL